MLIVSKFQKVSLVSKKELDRKRKSDIFKSRCDFYLTVGAFTLIVMLFNTLFLFIMVSTMCKCSDESNIEEDTKDCDGDNFNKYDDQWYPIKFYGWGKVNEKI